MRKLLNHPFITGLPELIKNELTLDLTQEKEIKLILQNRQISQNLIENDPNHSEKLEGK